MASFDALESDGVSRVGVGDWSDDIGQSETYDAHLSKNLGDDLLDDLDSYWEDINDRLTIARMVSDSIIKGMVSAVSEEAYERVVAKELEVAKLKNNNMCCCQFRDSEIDVSSSSLRKHDELRLLGHDREFIGLLNKAVKEQLEKLQKCIAITKGLKFRELSISTPDIKELIGNFEESSAVIKNDLDEAFYRLKATLKALCQQVDVIAHTPEHFVEEWKVVDLDIRKEVETMVFCTVVQGLQYECEKKVWDVNKVVALIDDKFNQISSLRHELSSIQKCFDNENLSPQVSIELDHYHRKFSSNHVPSSVQDGNGESKIRSMPEKLPSELKHMKSEELYLHLRTVVTEMKREHESTVHKMTEENFALKRELLKEREPVKERGPFAAAFKKDRDFELIKKNISEIIAKLDVIVGENEKLSEFCNHSREKLDSLLCENHHLKGLLSGQRREVLYLSMHASEKLLPHSWAEEESIHKLVGDLKDALRDELIEASISEEVFKCMIREMAAVRNSSCEDLDLMKSIIMQDIIKTIYEEAFYTVDVATKYRTEENLDLQSSITQQIYGIVFQEVLRDMSMELNELKVKCLVEDEGLVFLERKVTEIENELTRKVEQNQELKHSILVLENSIAKKDQLLLERTALHEKEKADFAEELNSLMCLSTHQEALLSERNEEILLVMGKLEGCQKQLQSYEFEVDKLNKAIELSKDELRKSDEEKTSIKSVLEQKQNYLSSIKVKNSEHNKHMESLCHFIRDLSKSFADFELRIKESMGWHDVRLENLASQLNSLIPKVNMLRRTGFLYKERLEKKSSDLEKAEAEVDLLGDEVDALLSLLEKIYVALDHYSPILQHYPGIIEILKLVKREVSGEAVKAI